MGLYVPLMLLLDANSARGVQTAIGVATWALLAVVFLAVERHERRQLVAVVIVATMLEVLCSIVWGLYVYRWDNLPLYVPPGHGLVYLLALRLAALRAFRWRRAPALAAVAATAWAAGALVLPARPDLVGATLLPILLVCLLAGPRATVYAGAFVATGGLEIFGTWFGTWSWQAEVPGLGMSMGNPPSAIAAGYCALDAVVLALCTWRFGLHPDDQRAQPSSPGSTARPTTRNSTPLSVQLTSGPAVASASATAAASSPVSSLQPSAGGSTTSTGQGTR